ncbi:tetratricopeptide repeat protein [Colwellia psychrerythraea]|uniref:Tetratricopeptide TPR_1 repeat-containing protein n=1 Tax=Colwellia psychrerythraea TaxID=28229 RepID=A0A099KZ64_COLPS|nr:tetratricopeptide repeat protein [Colwellia psychrerythraea]KGJ95896.1 Tetratricopeptide TPR_1 repeat-containing protein [Colwellia psychrerythraea]
MKSSCYGLFLCLPLLLACQSNEIPQANQYTSPVNLYLDSQFQSNTPIIIETEQEVFQLDDEMRAMVQTKLVNNFPANQKARILLKHLFNEENIALSYAGNANVTASQAYHSKVANCMSLTILAYALADEAGMNISFQQVEVPEYWVRNGQYSLVTGHVNLLVKASENVTHRTVWGESATRIDFDPFVAKKHFPSHKIEKHTLLAMFYNNKGAEAMVNDSYVLAYQYLKQATLTDNQFSSSWGNLGILYKLTGEYGMAESAYRHAFRLDSNNLTSLGNLALLLNKQGRFDEAEPIEELIHKARVKNPYYHALLASEAYFNKSYTQALIHFKKAIQLNDEQHEFYFGLAKTYYMQNELNLAKRAMTKAIALTKAKDTQRQYIAKLNFLKFEQTANN